METIKVENVVDDMNRSRWPKPGLWHDECDLMLYTHTPSGYLCVVIRNYMGHLCGYVCVTPAHKLHLKEYGDLDDKLHDVHGGITYSGNLFAEVKKHLPGKGNYPGAVDEEFRDLWLFGFDCAHAGDRVPAMPDFGFGDGAGGYKDLAFVCAATNGLAVILKEHEK